MSYPRFHDLNYCELEDGTIRLEQFDYSGEIAVIDLHPAQLRYIAETIAKPKENQGEE